MSNFGQDFLNDPLVRNSPSENEIELSVFGKGYGECLVLCCGHQEYIVVDSFINPSTNNPIAIDYLGAIGMPLNSIKEVVLTHWHKDHIEGISTILNNLGSNVKLILSPILKDDQFMEFIFRGIKEGQESTSELKKIFDFLHTYGNGVYKFAKQDTRIYSNEMMGNAEIYSLSPQDSEIMNYIKYLITGTIAKPYSYEYSENNLLSLVLLLKDSVDGILLGADLENMSTDIGWDAVVTNYSHTKTHPSVFKVPHHGSNTAHNDDVWKKILSPLPISILTVFDRSSKLPSDEDIIRLSGLSSKLYVVGNNAKEEKLIESRIRKKMPNIKVKAISSKIGLVRYRRKINNPSNTATVEFYGAVKEFMNHQS